MAYARKALSFNASRAFLDTGAVEREFEQFASDEELNLQPGQGYFLAKSEAEMQTRLRYEVLPLIKEYLVEGLLVQSKNAFSSFFYQSIKEVMFR